MFTPEHLMKPEILFSPTSAAHAEQKSCAEDLDAGVNDPKPAARAQEPEAQEQNPEGNPNPGGGQARRAEEKTGCGGDVMKIIGLTGQSGSGKDTVADFLCETHGFVKIAFADPIRAGLTAMFGGTCLYFSDRELKESTIPWIGKSPRELMQTLGTEWGRKLVNPDIWVNLAAKEVERLRKAPDYLHISGIVISDVRLENEGAWIRSQGGEIWRIKRRGNYSTLTEEARAHCSERLITHLREDRIIYNNCTIEVLHELIHTIITNEKEETS